MSKPRAWASLRDELARRPVQSGQGVRSDGTVAPNEAGKVGTCLRPPAAWWASQGFCYYAQMPPWGVWEVMPPAHRVGVNSCAAAQGGQMARCLPGLEMPQEASPAHWFISRHHRELNNPGRMGASSASAAAKMSGQHCATRFTPTIHVFYALQPNISVFTS